MYQMVVECEGFPAKKMVSSCMAVISVMIGYALLEAINRTVVINQAHQILLHFQKRK